MVSLSGIWNSINDKSWTLLDWMEDRKIPIGRFFDDHNIPPVLFPLLIIAIILILILLLFGAGGPVETPAECGDGMCNQNETFLTCPEDCKTNGGGGNEVKVKLVGSVPCEVTAKLYDTSATLLRSQSGQGNDFTFTGITADNVKLVLSGPTGKTQSTPYQPLREGANIISVNFDTQLCDGSPVSKGTLRLVVKDGSTGSLLNGASVTITRNSGSSTIETLVNLVNVDGTKDFELPASKEYVVYVEKSGYRSYDGSNEEVFISPGKLASKVVTLVFIDPIPPIITGDVEVCVLDAAGNPLEEGFVSLYTSSGTYLLNGDLKRASRGCLVFKVDGGSEVYATLNIPPSGCSTVRSNNTYVVAEMKTTLTLISNCEAVAYVKVKVYDSDRDVVTQNTTITVFANETQLPGNGRSGALAMGDGGYTEEISVPANIPIYALAVLEGYNDTQSDEYELDPNEHKSIKIYLNRTGEEPMPQLYNFSFQGVSAPERVRAGSEFAVRMNEVSYGTTILNGTVGTVTIDLNNVQCTVNYTDGWDGVCTAPNATGEYDLNIIARYEGHSDTHSLPIGVFKIGPTGRLTLAQKTQTDTDPPIKLDFEIKLNGNPVASLTESSVDYEFIHGGEAYSIGKPTTLSKVAGKDLFTTVADVPFKGDYRTHIYIETVVNGTIYNGTFQTEFRTLKASENLKYTIILSEQILGRSETFRVDAMLEFKGEPIEGLDFFQVLLGGVKYDMVWDEDHYTLPLTAPDADCGIYEMNFRVAGQPGAPPQKIYVVDITGAKASLCPLDRGSACSNNMHVKKCVYDYKTEVSTHAEPAIMACVEGGCPVVPDLECPGTNKGDLDGDYVLSQDDVDIIGDYANYINLQSERNRFVDCADMDGDGDVDEDDMECVVKVEAKEWYGETGHGSPTVSMDGGYCFLIDPSDAIPGDLDGDDDLDADDADKLGKIIGMIAKGVSPHTVTPDDGVIIEAADFNRDDAIDDTDLECLQAFRKVDWDNANALSGTLIPVECFNILGLECRGTKGDLDGDGAINNRDLLIARLLKEGYIEGELVGSGGTPVKDCADIDGDHAVTDADIQCLLNYIADPQSEDWLICINCTENTPPLAYGEEICNDGYDNNCDGLEDEEDPRCICNPETPCHMKFDLDGGASPGVADGNYKVCRQVSWVGGKYDWYKEEQLVCTLEHNCGVVRCPGRYLLCSSPGGGQGKWYNVPHVFGHVFPQGDCNEKCSGAPEGYYLPCEDQWDNLCEDGWNNDCDVKFKDCDCKEPDSCFPAGTRITMSDGSTKNIEDVKVGEFVASYDTNSGKQVAAEVLELESPVRYHLYTLTFEDGEVLRTTSEHPLYVAGKGWSSIDPEATYGENQQVVARLEIGDRILNADDEWVQLVDIAFERIPEGIQTYNLKRILDHNNFYADAFLVHNKW
jgi:hypothetical protein